MTTRPSDPPGEDDVDAGAGAQTDQSGRWSTAWKAAREAGWGADSDELIKLLTFVIVFGQQSLPERWRRPRPPLAIDAVRLGGQGDDAHTHVVGVRCTDGVARAAEEVIFGLRYQRATYVTIATDGERISVVVSRCQICGRDTLSAEVDERLLFTLPRF